MNNILPQLAPLATPIASLVPDPRNARKHDAKNIEAIAQSLQKFGQRKPIVVQQRADGSMLVRAGNGTVEAARRLGWTELAAVVVTEDDELAGQFAVADNRSAELAQWNPDLLTELLGEWDEETVASLGFDSDDIAALVGADGSAAGEQAQEEAHAKLADQFLVPPFTVMDACKGWWADRKRAWLAIGIASEVGRPESHASMKHIVEIQKPGEEVPAWVSSSIFDPVLCEIAYRWFCPPGGRVIDPFAGGSVRGVVASRLGLHYHGFELRLEQVEANIQQVVEICRKTDPTPQYVVGDSAVTVPAWHGEADLLFTCPPYGDLEVYSDLPEDISGMEAAEFAAAYRSILAAAAAKLKPNSFAVIVVGEYRDKDGNYANIVGLTVDAMAAAGLKYYNEAVLVTAVGTLPVRAGRTFKASRKLGKRLQNVLVFVKGKGQEAAARCGPVDVEQSLDALELEDPSSSA